MGVTIAKKGILLTTTNCCIVVLHGDAQQSDCCVCSRCLMTLQLKLEEYKGPALCKLALVSNFILIQHLRLQETVFVD